MVWHELQVILPRLFWIVLPFAVWQAAQPVGFGGVIGPAAYGAAKCALRSSTVFRVTSAVSRLHRSFCPLVYVFSPEILHQLVTET